MCRQVGGAHFLPAVPEASGVAYAGGVLWTHNDSDAPALYSIDASGRAKPVTVDGANVVDWEDLAAGPCADSAKTAAGGRCLYIADIGDNRESRDRITVYVVPVPPGSTSVTVTNTIHGRYPDRPHDAEALLITTAGTFITTKDVPARFYTRDDFLNGRKPARIDLSRFHEPQGEGVTFGTAGDLYLVSEGGGRSAAGVLTGIDCAPLR